MRPEDLPPEVRKVLGIPEPATSPVEAALQEAMESLGKLNALIAASNAAPALAPFLLAECETACLHAAARYREAARRASQRVEVLAQRVRG